MGAARRRAHPVFDDTVAWLAVACSKTAVTELMRIAWRTVGAIVARVWADVDETVDRFAGLRRIGIDEICYKRDHKYLTIVVDHDTGRLVWAAAGPRQGDAAALLRPARRRTVRADHPRVRRRRGLDRRRGRRTLPERGPLRRPVPRRRLGHRRPRRRAAPGLERRRALARTEPKRGRGRPGEESPPRPGHEQARKLKDARYALWKNPENLTERQTAKLAWIAKTDTRLYRAYLLKEGLRHVFAVKGAGRQGGPRPVDVVGPPLPHPRLRRAGQPHRSDTATRSTPPSTTACPTR